MILFFCTCVQSINTIHNRSGSYLLFREAAPEFYRLVSVLRDVPKSGAVGMRIELGKDQSEATVFTFRQKHIDPAVESKISAAKRLMGLKTGPQEFNVVYGSAPKDDAQIAVFSRSILEIIIELAPYMDVPQEDIEEGRSYPTLVDQMDVSAEFEPLITINSQMDKPLDAFIAVPFQGHWFWVDDRDFSSKRMFSFLLLLFSFLNRKNP